MCLALKHLETNLESDEHLSEIWGWSVFSTPLLYADQCSTLDVHVIQYCLLLMVGLKGINMKP